MGMSNVWKPLSVVSGLLLLLTYLLIQSRSPDLALRARMQEALQTLQLHDTELTRDVLLARAGLLPHYDSLPRTGQSLSRTLGTLRAESATVSGQAAQDMGQHVEALAAALHQKLTLVEYFTSDNALLRNSLTYLTYAGQTLGPRVEAEPAVAADIAALSHVLLRFIHTPEPSVGQEVGAALQRLSQTPLFPQDFQTLVAHGRLIMEVLPQVDTLLRQIIAAPTAAHAAAFQDAVLQDANRVEARAERVSGAAVSGGRHAAGLSPLPIRAAAGECPGSAPCQCGLTAGDGRASAGSDRLARQRRTLPCHHGIGE